MSSTPSSFEVFDKDAQERGGYGYTFDRLSSRTSNKRMSDGILGLNLFQGKSVIDVGCGDGTYTTELFDGGAKSVLGVDPAPNAIEVAKTKAVSKDGKVSEFHVCNAYELQSLGKTFDVAVMRGVIHHIPEPFRAIAQTCKIAKDIIVLEPNGHNPVLKLIECFSPYHVEHGELSYLRSTLVKWFKDAGADVQSYVYIGLVPIFCADWAVKPLKALEKPIESIPLVRDVVCGQVVIHFRSTVCSGA